LLESYFQELLETIAASPIVRLYDATLDRRAPRAGLIRGSLYFADGSRLHFRELVEFQTQVVRLRYSYHYQRTDHSLIFRYDDTAHYPDLPNYPHHKHVGGETDVLSASSPDLHAVLLEIETTYPLST
jgi:hypothetical protein